MDGPMWKLFEGNMASQKKIFDPMDQLNKDTVKQFMDIKEELVANGDDDEASAWLWLQDNYPTAQFVPFTTITSIDAIEPFRVLF